ncbi:MAG: hypothetical protein R3178_05910 [Rhodothermales bacterium]|nr:hypothetical protein [Rhodothermales bacterium]
MNIRKLASTLATAVLLLAGSSLLSACADSFVADGPEMAEQSIDVQSGKQIERYFLPPPPPPDDGTTSGSRTSTATDSTSTR